MNVYPLLRPLLFALPAEVAHDLSLSTLPYTHRLWRYRHPGNPTYRALGQPFANRVGLAAGLDKNGRYPDYLASLGFGHIEVGTITPRAQPGNPTPRMFRLPHDHAIINRMGFNNDGADAMAANLEKRRRDDYRLGVNIGKNKDTPNERAVDDYLACLERLYCYADYITVNISSPNTPGLRDLQGAAERVKLMSQLVERREQLAVTHGRKVPFVLKIAPDMADDDLPPLVDDVATAGFDGIIATNTTNSRTGLRSNRDRDQQGGLSGAPLRYRSRCVSDILAPLCKARGIALVSVGGIGDADEAAQRIATGADLVQLYSGLIYQGPLLVKQALEGVDDACRGL